MIAVIFIAEVGELPQQYYDLASEVRILADQYGCQEFVSVSENGKEISISYWQSQDQIQRWKQDPTHLKAQKLGQEQWYKSYKVQVVDILREYNHGNA
jgi:heme-degrading monooxygenase HmoA